jgi:hypothetical protein
MWGELEYRRDQRKGEREKGEKREERKERTERLSYGNVH